MNVSFTVELDETVLSKLDALAKETDRSRDRLVSEALEGFLEIEAEQVAKIKEGIEQADRGEFASESEVRRVLTKYRQQ